MNWRDKARGEVMRAAYPMKTNMDRTDDGLREKVAQRIKSEIDRQGVLYAFDDADRAHLSKFSINTGEQVDLVALVERILALPEIAEALLVRKAWLVDRMDDLPPERVGEIMRKLQQDALDKQTMEMSVRTGRILPPTPLPPSVK